MNGNRSRERKSSIDGRLSPKDPYFNQQNPKDLVAQTRLDTSLVPDAFFIELALAFYEGALKYGRYNWRMAPVKASVYFSAFERHFKKWNAGEQRDKKTRIHHLGYVGCCAAILLDAEMRGTLVDDRPPHGRKPVDISAWLDGEVKQRITHLQKLFKEHNPRQFTIQDDFGLINKNPHINQHSQRRSKVRSGRKKFLVLGGKGKGTKSK